ncbi:MAG TPA: hypothetical protein RMH99_26905 [Sandaracinaceae bacterium LLY-WYZ-13_1]|nr:hypothetical protein [Sandaracinaceae bacterium LLY-WYZ-13_1]
MTVRGVLFTVAVGALFFLLFRELWRFAGPRLRATRDRRAREAAIDARTEEALGTGGATPDRAVSVRSASVVEARATSDPCVVCGGNVVSEGHAVETFGERRLRVVRLACRRCGHRRPFYVHIEAAPVLH